MIITLFSATGGKKSHVIAYYSLHDILFPPILYGVVFMKKRLRDDTLSILYYDHH